MADLRSTVSCNSVALLLKLIAAGWVIAPLCGEESLDSAGQCTGEEPGIADLPGLG